MEATRAADLQERLEFVLLRQDTLTDRHIRMAATHAVSFNKLTQRIAGMQEKLVDWHEETKEFTRTLQSSIDAYCARVHQPCERVKWIDSESSSLSGSAGSS